MKTFTIKIIFDKTIIEIDRNVSNSDKNIENTLTQGEIRMLISILEEEKMKLIPELVYESRIKYGSEEKEKN